MSNFKSNNENMLKLILVDKKTKLRTQMSFEFMIYLAISLSSLLIGITIFIHFHSSIINLSNKIYFEQFASEINENIGFQSSNFKIFIPATLCNKTILTNIFNSDNLILTANNIIINKTVCKNNQIIGSFKIYTSPNGNIELK